MSTLRVARLMPLVLAATLLASGVWSQEAQTEATFFAGITGSGARAMGMGGAFIGIADDATAASWNPAGLCVLEKPEAALAGQPLTRYQTENAAQQNTQNYTYESVYTYPSYKRTSTTDRKTTSPLNPWTFKANSATLDFLSFTYPLRIKSVKLVPQLSYQRVVDLGIDYKYQKQDGPSTASSTNGTSYSGSVPFQPSRIFTNTTGTSGSQYDSTASGGIDLVSASVGVSFIPQLYLGLSINRWMHGATRQMPYTTWGQNSDVSTYEGTTGPASREYSSRTVLSAYTTDEDFSGTSWHVGVLVKPHRLFSIGAVYKPGFNLDYDRTISYSSLSSNNYDYPDPPASYSAAQRDYYTKKQEQHLDSSRSTLNQGSVNWPASWGVGLAFMPTETLTLGLDYSQTRWSKTQYDYTSSGEYLSYSNTSKTTYASGRVQDSQVQPPPPSAPTQLTNGWPRTYTPSLAEDGLNRYQRDSNQLRLGGEFILRKPGFLNLTALPLRAGVLRDGQITPNASDLSNVAYTGLTLGFGLVWSRLSFDVAFVHTQGQTDDTFANVARPSSSSGSGSGYTFVSNSNTNYTLTADGKTKYKANRLICSAVFRLP